MTQKKYFIVYFFIHMYSLRIFALNTTNEMSFTRNKSENGQLEKSDLSAILNIPNTLNNKSKIEMINSTANSETLKTPNENNYNTYLTSNSSTVLENDKISDAIPSLKVDEAFMKTKPSQNVTGSQDDKINQNGLHIDQYNITNNNLQKKQGSAGIEAGVLKMRPDNLNPKPDDLKIMQDNFEIDKDNLKMEEEVSKGQQDDLKINNPNVKKGRPDTIMKRHDFEENIHISDEFKSKMMRNLKDTEKQYNFNLNTESVLSIPNQRDLFVENYQTSKSNGCSRPATCEPVAQGVECFGVKLPYSQTSRNLTGLSSQRVAMEELKEWYFLKNIPRCWLTVQPFLCAIYFPPCENSSVEIPAQKLCLMSRGPCRLVEIERKWPEYLQCKKDHPYECESRAKLSFNTTGQCVPPLVPTKRESAWYGGVRDCGMQCEEPSLTKEEREDVRWFLGTFGAIALAFSILTLLTYLIDWRSSNKYPALIIFYMNGCFAMTCIGFLVQFHAGSREEIICRTDGTLRTGEPSSDGTLSCVVIFVCIYYFMVANGMWLIILSYAWHTGCKSLAAGTGQQEVERKSAYFHLIAWSIPLVMTITIMTLAEVEGDPVTGVCFLSSRIQVRVWALLLPFCAMILISGYFFVRGLLCLVKLKLEHSNIMSENANSKISVNIMRLVLFMIGLVVVMGITIYYHIYYFINEEQWAKSLKDYVMCVSKISPKSETSPWSSCSFESKPSINMYKLHLLALFGSGIMISSWCWTSNSIKAWKRFLRRVAGVDPGEPPVHLRKHKVIAQAFAKRHDFNAGGRLSISLCSANEDPLGMNFDVNSCTSGDVSSIWAAAIPHLLNRRGAVVGHTALGPRRNSIDSEFGNSRRLSLESGYTKSSRRHSLDSQASLRVSDVERMAALHTVAKFSWRRRSRRDWLSLRRSRKGQIWDRRSSRGSNTSDDSNFGSVALPSIAIDTQDSLFTNMMKRLNKLNLSSEDGSRSQRDKIFPHQSNQSKTSSGKENGVENVGYADDDIVTSEAILASILKSQGENVSEGILEAAMVLVNSKNKQNSDKSDYSNDIKSYKSDHKPYKTDHTNESQTNNSDKISDVNSLTKSTTVAVQTLTHMVDKSCQVTTPILTRAMAVNKNNIQVNEPSSFDEKIDETSFITKPDNSKQSDISNNDSNFFRNNSQNKSRAKSSKRGNSATVINMEEENIV